MSATVLLFLIVFRPNDSRPVLDIANEESLYRYIWRFVVDKGGILYAVGGMPDHIHMLVELPPTIPLAVFMRDLKTSTSKFLKYNVGMFPYFEQWGKGYFCETHSLSQKDTIRAYIKGQKQHHQKISFADELRKLYLECGLPVDQYFMSE